MSTFAQVYTQAQAQVVRDNEVVIGGIKIANVSADEGLRIAKFVSDLLAGTSTPVSTPTPVTPVKSSKQFSDVTLYFVQDGQFVGVSEKSDEYVFVKNVQARKVANAYIREHGGANDSNRKASEVPSYMFASKAKATAFCKNAEITITADEQSNVYERSQSRKAKKNS